MGFTGQWALYSASYFVLTKDPDARKLCSNILGIAPGWDGVLENAKARNLATVNIKSADAKSIA